MSTTTPTNVPRETSRPRVEWAAGFDRHMVVLAARRAVVNVQMPDGSTVDATLICWCPRRGSKGARLWQARVEFLNGRRRTVSAGDVTPKEMPDL